MKMKSAIMLSLIGLGLISQGYAQGQQNTDQQRFKNDPTYSTNNYKHANKAAATRRWEDKKGVVLQQPATNNGNLANYKRQNPNSQPVGSITVGHEFMVSEANRNYKTQQVNQPVGATNSVITRKVKRRSDDSTAVGD